MKRLIGYTAALCLLALMVGCGGVTNTGTLAYISNSTGTGFTVYNVNTDGTLTLSSISPQSAPAAPKVLQFSPNGNWAYYLDNGGDTLYAYTRAGNGDLATNIACVNNTATNCGGYPVGPGASSLVISPNSQFIYVALPASQQLAVFSIDQATGVPSQVGSNLQVGYSITQLVINSGGTLLFGLDPSQQAVVPWTLNSSSGIATRATPTSVGTSPSWMTLSPNGSFLYVLDSTGGTVTSTTSNGAPVYSPGIFTFNVNSTGALTAQGPTVQNPDINGIHPTAPVAAAITSDNRFLFVANLGTKNISAFKITTTSGTLTEVLGATTTVNGITTSTASPFDCPTGCSSLSYLSIPSANNALYVLDTPDSKVFQYQINQNTGQLRVNNPVSVSGESATSNPTWITFR